MKVRDNNTGGRRRKSEEMVEGIRENGIFLKDYKDYLSTFTSTTVLHASIFILSPRFIFLDPLSRLPPQTNTSSSPSLPTPQLVSPYSRRLSPRTLSSVYPLATISALPSFPFSSLSLSKPVVFRPILSLFLRNSYPSQFSLPPRTRLKDFYWNGGNLCSKFPIQYQHSKISEEIKVTFDFPPGRYRKTFTSSCSVRVREVDFEGAKE